MTDAFTSSADYYEVLSDSAARLEREGPLLRETFEGAPGVRVADIACGTGLHAGFFASLGAEVDGFDISAEMIARAGRLHPHPKAAYHSGDMRELSGGPWDMAVCLGNSLSVLASGDDLAAVFRAVHTSLSPGGIFLVHILNYRAGKTGKPRHRIEHGTVDGTSIVAVKNLVPRGDRTLLSLSFFREVNGSWSSLSETAVLRNWTDGDITAAAEKAGFAVGAVYGGFDRSAYDPVASPDLVCILRKS